MNPTIETILSRKSVRHFKSGVIEKSTLELILRAGMSAPSAVDKRPWEFILITDKNALVKLADMLPYAKMAEKAAAGIIVAGNIRKQWGGEDSDYWIQDCCAASENILLAVESLGLGAVWTALHPYEDRKKPVIELLNLPSHIKPLNFIPIGIPEGTERPKDKFDRGVIHYEKW